MAGEVVGTAIWSLERDEDVTVVEFDLAVDGARPWMRRFAPLARPLVRWNHQRLMEQGRLGLLAQLGAEARAQR